MGHQIVILACKQEVIEELPAWGLVDFAVVVEELEPTLLLSDLTNRDKVVSLEKLLVDHLNDQ